MVMTVHTLDPLSDPRWPRLVSRHPLASAFHSTGWLNALHLAYGYEPVVFTTSPPEEELRNGLVVCRVKSWLTGKRLVSLPFSDHCEPIVEGGDDLKLLLAGLVRAAEVWKCKYLEIRPQPSTSGIPGGMDKGDSYYFHKLDLRPSLEDLFQGFHKDCVQRKIRRAERENLTYQCGKSEDILRAFYQMMILTRRRHRLPPPPLAWYRTLVGCMGDAVNIHLASKDGRPVASILTLHHRSTLFYKYGCSDKDFSKLGGMHFLFWKAIQDAKRRGIVEFDLGRSDLNNPGLVDFKDRWGAVRSDLVYWRYAKSGSKSATARGSNHIARRIFEHLPDGPLVTLGNFLYRHLG